MADTFKAGDEVRHKSGGPKMVVTGDAGPMMPRMVNCEWIEQGQVKRANFKPEVLVKADDDPV